MEHGLADRDVSLRLYEGGIQFTSKPKLRTQYSGVQHKRGKRGRISGFSPASRLRLLKLLSQVNFSASPAVFVSLTYGKDAPTPEEAQRHLDSFLKRVRRVDGDCKYLWRLEEQERGALHYHVLLFTSVKLLGMSWWQRRAWNRVIGEKTRAHRLFGARVDRVRQGGRKRLQSYLTKYVAKESLLQTPFSGRRWGRSRNLSDLTSPVVCSKFLSDYKLLRRICRRAVRNVHARRASRRGSGYIFLGEALSSAFIRLLIPDEANTATGLGDPVGAGSISLQTSIVDAQPLLGIPQGVDLS